LAGSCLSCGTDDLLDAYREGAPCVDTHERAGQAGEAGARLPLQTGEETIQPVGVCARFGHHHFIASQPVDRRWRVDGLTTEQPTPHGPWECRGEPALDGAVTPACARP